MKAFDSSEFEKYKAEAKEKWGQTPVYQEYEAKTKDNSQPKWSGLAEEMDRIMGDFGTYMKMGKAPDSTEAQTLVKRLQNHITENYYPCTDQILAGLGQMYVADERFKNNIDRCADGTADFICKAIKSYCEK